MSNYKIENSKIIFDSGNEIDFHYKIDIEQLEIDGVLIITLSVPQLGDWLLNKQNDDYRRNVFGINLTDKKILWQLENNEKLLGQYHGPKRDDKNSNDVFLWGHPNIVINPYNGKIIEIKPVNSQWDL